MIMHLQRVTRDDVVKYLRENQYDENALQLRLEAFGGMTAEEFAYEVGWGKVLGILRRAFA